VALIDDMRAALAQYAAYHDSEARDRGLWIGCRCSCCVQAKPLLTARAEPDRNLANEEYVRGVLGRLE
jgi:hypothetical protein